MILVCFYYYDSKFDSKKNNAKFDFSCVRSLIRMRYEFAKFVKNLKKEIIIQGPLVNPEHGLSGI
jgi:hypothetical protein